MRARRHLMAAVAALALSSSALAVAPAGAASDPIERSSATDLGPGASAPQALTPPLLQPRGVVTSPRGAAGDALARQARRPLFAFWGKKYNQIDGFVLPTAKRGSGTAVQVSVAWKTYRGVKPLLPKVFVQRQVDGGRWEKVSGARGRIRRRLAVADIGAYAVPAGVAAQSVAYRLKTKKLKKGPRRARRSVKSDPVTVTYDNQAMYGGTQAYYYNTIASLCPNASITFGSTSTTVGADAIFSWQNGITIDDVALAAQNNDAVENESAAVHECAHFRQFYNWGGTRRSWSALVKRSGEIFVADLNPDLAVVTPPMDPKWAPLEHAADCATLAIYPTNVRTYGGYCNPAELASAALLWQGQKY